MTPTASKYPCARIQAALHRFALVGTCLLLAAAVTSHAQTAVRDLDNAARQPFQAELQRPQLRIPVPEGRELIRVIDVPAGKRLVVEHVSFRVESLEATTPGGRQQRFLTAGSLVTKANDVAANHELLIHRADLGISSSNVASQSVRAYADPGSQVFVAVGGRTEDGEPTVVRVTNLTISGHLVALP